MNQGFTNNADESLDFPSEVGKFAKVRLTYQSWRESTSIQEKTTT
jgi:hypothetical protein